MPSIFERWRKVSIPSVINVTVSGDASMQVLNMTAAELYRTQDNLYSTVSFLSHNLAQLPLKVYIRNGENDRERDRKSVASKVLWKPNDYQTQFEFIRALCSEYYVFGCVYVWVVPDKDNVDRYTLHIIPTNWVIGSRKSPYGPNLIKVRSKSGAEVVEIPSTEWVRFATYNPGDPATSISPIRALKQTLYEQIESGRFRRQLWRSSGRLNAQVIRPKDVAPWNDQQRENFVTMFREAWSGTGSKAGSIPLMEDGMEIKPFSTSFKEYEWASSVTLSRESVAAAYRVNPSLIWHSNTQTYASAKDNARALYAECLGPDIQFIQQRFNAFLLPMIGADPDKTYVEFDLQEKLKGSFEEQAAIISTATGRPWMLVDEARALVNLPKLPNGQGEGLVIPLNVEVSGQANPGNDYSYPGVDNNAKKLEPCGCKSCKEQTELRIKGRSDKDDDEKVQTVLTEFFKRQARSIIPKISAGTEDFWNAERWDKELKEDLEPVLIEIADKHGKSTAEQLGSEYGTEVTRKYLASASEARAKKINEGTLRAITKELNRDFEDDEEPDISKVYETRENTSGTLAKSAAGAIASFATQEAAHQAISDGASRVVGRVVERMDHRSKRKTEPSGYERRTCSA
jgi:phage portal protein, HK97 family